MVAIDHTSQGNRATLRWLLYDGHGNLVRTMAPDYALSAWQFRGVWGEVQGTLGAGRGYCANLGHPEDETGLVYMRARYYEPATGRFISEDPARDGVNWYLYADGNPVNKVDAEGKFDLALWTSAIPFWLFGLSFSRNFRIFAYNFVMNFLVYLVDISDPKEVTAYDLLGKSVFRWPLHPLSSDPRMEVSAFYAGYQGALMILMAFLYEDGGLL